MQVGLFQLILLKDQTLQVKAAIQYTLDGFEPSTGWVGTKKKNGRKGWQGGQRDMAVI